MRKLYCVLFVVLAATQVQAGTVLDFKNAGDVTVGDKTFTFGSATDNLLPTSLSVSNIVPEFFTLTLGDGSQNILGAGGTGPAELAYDVHINNPNFVFTLASLDTTFLGAKTEVDEFITPSGPVVELKSLDGSATLIMIDGQTIHVDDKISINPLSAILSMQNSFLQRPIPEPRGILMWSLGLVGLVVFSRFRRRRLRIA